MPLDVRLVNMPFWQASMPALSLTQLKRRALDVLGPVLDIEIEYVNHDFAHRLGADLYDHVALNGALLQSGFGDWLFRRIAFPDMADNTTSYLRRYGRTIGAELTEAASAGGPLSSERLEAHLENILVERGLDQADLVGFTSTFAQTVPSLAMARVLRRRRPDQILIMGGANCEGEMGEALAQVAKDLDFIFSGPALVSLPRRSFLAMIAARRTSHGVIQGGHPLRFGTRQPVTPSLSVPSVTFGAELPIETPVALDYDDFMASYDQVPAPKREPNLSFETSRGCWWGQKAHCTFCGTSTGATMAYRAMPAPMARDLITNLLDRYGDQVKLYNSVDNIMPKEYVGDLFATLRPADDIEIFYETKADLLDAHVATLADACVRRIQPGIESLLTSTLKLMRKGTTAFHNIRLLMSCRRYDVVPEWNLLVGFPGETAETFRIYEALLPKLFHLYPPSGAYSVRFDRFSPYFKNTEEYGLELAPANYYRYCYDYSDETIAKIAYFFQNLNITSSYYEPMAEGLGPVEAITAEWNRRWSGPDAERPFLSVKPAGDGALVADGRGADVVQIALEPRHLGILANCREVTEISAVDADRGAYDDLLGWGLLFEERGRVLSLLDLGGLPAGAHASRRVALADAG